MRKDTSVVTEPQDEEPKASAEASVVAPERKSQLGALTAMMALEEPARTDALERAVNAGLTVNLRSKTGKDVQWRYGEHILVVPPKGKPFAAPHAIHLLFCAPDLVEEVEE